MYKVKLCLATGNFGISTEEQIRLFRQVGFEGFFTGHSTRENIRSYRKIADAEGMYYQSLHAPFGDMQNLWRGNEKGLSMQKMLIDCVETCAENDIPVMVSHAFIGFYIQDLTPTQIGLSLLEPVMRRAEELGVKVAYENTEGEEYLAAIMAHFRGSPALGFCLDTGHEMCYNYGKDLLALYGDKLIATHLNDNLGVRDYGGHLTYLDDLHLLPFDGIGDWANITARMKAHGFNAPLTFELKMQSHEGRHDNDCYMAMSPVAYVTEAYKRACRVGALFARG